MPDSIRTFGVSIDPQETITSRRAPTVEYVNRSGFMYSTPRARLSSSMTMRLTQQPVRTLRFERDAMIGCR